MVSLVKEMEVSKEFLINRDGSMERCLPFKKEVSGLISRVLHGMIIVIKKNIMFYKRGHLLKKESC